MRSLCQTNKEKINLTKLGKFTHNVCIKVKTKNKCGINYSVYLLQQ